MKFILKDHEDKEPKIKLWLEDRKDGVVLLCAKDIYGREKYIMEFRNGRFHRWSSAYLEGLETDENGRIKEDD